MNRDEMEAWETTKNKGIFKYILINGVLIWGGMMFVAMAFMNKPFAEGFTSKAAIIHYIVWPSAGVLFGILTWFIAQIRYKKARKQAMK
ncbi:hypothetical protein SOPP22_12570 [Shewanella sp. OPT22]|nr:hypothetical protein SOPP22_12570 [Shewanella sp. OPT22]